MPATFRTLAAALLAAVLILPAARAAETTRIEGAEAKQPIVSGTPALPPSPSQPHPGASSSTKRMPSSPKPPRASAPGSSTLAPQMSMSMSSPSAASE